MKLLRSFGGLELVRGEKVVVIMVTTRAPSLTGIANRDSCIFGLMA